MLELDNLDIRILIHLLDNSRKSFQEIAKQCLTSVRTVKSRVDRLLELGVIKKFTVEIDDSKLGVPEVIFIINAKHSAVSRITEELMGLEELKRGWRPLHYMLVQLRQFDVIKHRI